ncbi:MAG: HAMP domain-containing sensor histidine kinase [Verrucomicrobiota bacterium]
MRLSDFILQGMEEIIVEWERFAGTLYPVDTHMTRAGLRDHSKQILQAIAADLRTEQSDSTQSLKSQGLVARPAGAPETAAQTHAVLRAQSGIDINQLASEYRALRASVLHLWGEDQSLDGRNLQEVIRFNEAIDQALAESISFFSAQVDRSRNLLMGILGHDMRSPLNAITLTAELLACLNAGAEVSEAARCLMDSGAEMESLLNDLVDFSRKKLGLGIGIEVGPVDLGALCANEIRQQRAAHPGCQLELKLDGDLHGLWDGARLRQVLRNLLSNAIAYGAAGEPVTLTASGQESEVCLEVRNTGPTIDAKSARRIFEPLQRDTAHGSHANRKGLGLGLFIVREITQAHGGRVELHSADSETRFSVHLPRLASA